MNEKTIKYLKRQLWNKQSKLSNSKPKLENPAIPALIDSPHEDFKSYRTTIGIFSKHLYKYEMNYISKKLSMLRIEHSIYGLENGDIQFKLVYNNKEFEILYSPTSSVDNEEKLVLTNTDDVMDKIKKFVKFGFMSEKSINRNYYGFLSRQKKIKLYKQERLKRQLGINKIWSKKRGLLA